MQNSQISSPITSSTTSNSIPHFTMPQSYNLPLQNTGKMNEAVSIAQSAATPVQTFVQNLDPNVVVTTSILESNVSTDSLNQTATIPMYSPQNTSVPMYTAQSKPSSIPMYSPQNTSTSIPMYSPQTPITSLPQYTMNQQNIGYPTSKLISSF